MKSSIYRSHSCGELRIADLGINVTLSGWVDRYRNLGSLIFVDLRDRFGIIQLRFDAKKKSLFDEAVALRTEWVISVKGRVEQREKRSTNSNMSTAEIEVQVEDIQVLSESTTVPFPINDREISINEELRLKYRYLDIRRGVISNNLAIRHRAQIEIRNYLDRNGFLEISTPILAKSTPEGARDYLVPSRIHPGCFYALPQSPQLFKQLLMIGGVDRYFQIAACFRDEDLRSDRQPEFTQVDMEMSFASPEELLTLTEELIAHLFKVCRGISVPTPFRRMSYQDCLTYYGTDRPDLRFQLPLISIDSTVLEDGSPLKQLMGTKNLLKALLIPGKGSSSRQTLACYMEQSKQFPISHFIWIKLKEGIFSSNMQNIFGLKTVESIALYAQMKEGDLLLVTLGEENRVNSFMDFLRRFIGEENGWIPQDDLAFLWVTDFPLLRWNQEEEKMESEHHPFTAPHPEDIELLSKDPLKTRAVAYDLVLNGYEIGGGSQRIHQRALQEKIFNLLRLNPAETKEKFGFFLEALSYGPPPHLGIALGLDRIIMLLTQADNIRDVIAFPKTLQGKDLMMDAPAKVNQSQLDQLYIASTDNLNIIA